MIQGHRGLQTFFEASILKTDTCWIWQKRLNVTGYSEFPVYEFQVRGHRYSYELYREELHATLAIDHLCRTPACVNPDHLDPVLNSENARRVKMTRKEVEARRLLLPPTIITGAPTLQQSHVFTFPSSNLQLPIGMDHDGQVYITLRPLCAWLGLGISIEVKHTNANRHPHGIKQFQRKVLYGEIPSWYVDLQYLEMWLGHVNRDYPNDDDEVMALVEWAYQLRHAFRLLK